MTCALVTLLAPSVKAMAPAALSRPISAISSPRSPLVSAAIGCTCTIEVSRARRSTKSTMAGSSITGEVSGWHTMVVTPPAAAAWLAEAMVSRYSAPGSPTKARMSMRPGATSLPLQSMTSVPRARRRRRCRAWPRGSRHRRSGDRRRCRDRATGRGCAHWRAGSGGARSASSWRHRLARPALKRRPHAFGRFRDSASSTAMRTATPISTCSRISDWAPSATAVSISTPRFIGPGCMTSASGLA